jgi:hypothetical protein
MTTNYLSNIPNGRKQYLDGNGNPLAGGTVAFYAPGTTSFLTVYSDIGGTTPLTNPVVLDSSGCCTVFGIGQFREYVEDAFGNLISDQEVTSGPVSLAMAPVVNAATTDNALSDLGITTMLPFVKSSTVTGATNLLEYLSSATGAVTRSLPAKLGDLLSICDFGGVGDGTTDNSAALNAALAALGTGGGSIFFPPGKYYFASAISYSYPATNFYAVTIFGFGSNNTELYWNGTHGLTINCQNSTHSFHMQGVSLTTGKAGSYDGLTLNNSVLEGNFAQSTLKDVTVRGDDGGQQTDYWAVGVKIVGLSNVNFYDVLVYGNAPGTGGTGISVAGNAGTSPYFGLVYNLFGCGFYNNGIGFNYGTEIQGVSISTSNFTNGQTGILLPAGATGGAQLTVTGSQINTTANQIDIQAELASLIVTGNVIFVPANGSGILWGVGQGTGNQNTIVGNTFAGISATGSTGIAAEGTVGNTTVSGNTFYNLANGIDLSGANNWNVSTNSYASVTAEVINPIGGGGNTVSVPIQPKSIAATNTGSAVTTLSATTGVFTALCSGTVYVFGDAHSTGTAMATCAVTASLSGLVANSSGAFGSGGSAMGYLPMLMGQTSTFTVTATQGSAALMVSVRAFFVPNPV